MADATPGDGPQLSLFILPSIDATQPGQWVTGSLADHMKHHFGTAIVRSADTEQAKLSVPMYSAMIPKDGGPQLRDDANVAGFSAVILDIDSKDGMLWPEELEEELQGVAYAVHTTWSNSTEVSRFRLILLLSRPVMDPDIAQLRKKFAQIWIAVYDLLGQPKGIDPSTTDLSRGYFFPSCPTERAGAFQSYWRDGEPLDPDTLLDQVDALTATNRLLAMRRDLPDAAQTNLATLNPPAPPQIQAEAPSGTQTSPGEPSPSTDSSPTPPGSLPDGARNNELFRSAKDLIRRERRDRAWELINQINSGATPPLEMREVVTIFNSAEKYIVEERAKNQASLAPQITASPWFNFTDEASEPIVPPQWLIPDVLEYGQVGSLYADGGLGKSRLAIQLAVCRALGQPFLTPNMTFQPGPMNRTLLINCEDGKDKLRRVLRETCAYYGKTEADLGGRVIGWDRRGMNNSLMDWGSSSTTGSITAFWHELRQAIIESGADLIFLDTRDDFFSGDASNNAQVRQFIQMCLTTLAAELNITIIIIGHVSAEDSQGKSAKGFAGAMAWKNTVRVLLNMTRVDGTGGNIAKPLVRLELKKANNAPVRVLSVMREQYPIWVDHELVPDPEANQAQVAEQTLRGVVGDRMDGPVLMYQTQNDWIVGRVREVAVRRRQQFSHLSKTRNDHSLAYHLFQMSQTASSIKPFANKAEAQSRIELLVKEGKLIEVGQLHIWTDERGRLTGGNVLIPPEHAEMWESMRTAKAWEQLASDNWERQIDEVLGGLISARKETIKDKLNGKDYLDQKFDYEQDR